MVHAGTFVAVVICVSLTLADLFAPDVHVCLDPSRWGTISSFVPPWVIISTQATLLLFAFFTPSDLSTGCRVTTTWLCILLEMVAILLIWFSRTSDTCLESPVLILQQIVLFILHVCFAIGACYTWTSARNDAKRKEQYTPAGDEPSVEPPRTPKKKTKLPPGSSSSTSATATFKVMSTSSDEEDAHAVELSIGGTQGTISTTPDQEVFNSSMAESKATDNIRAALGISDM